MTRKGQIEGRSRWGWVFVGMPLAWYRLCSGGGSVPLVAVVAVVVVTALGALGGYISESLHTGADHNDRPLIGVIIGISLFIVWQVYVLIVSAVIRLTGRFDTEVKPRRAYANYKPRHYGRKHLK